MATTTDHELPENLAGDGDNESPEAVKPKTGPAASTRRTTASMHLGRAVYVVITAVLVGAFVWTILNKNEKVSINRQFRGVADEAYQRLAFRLDTLRMAATTMGEIAAISFPSASDWPNVWIEGFSSIALSMAVADPPGGPGNLESLFLAPLVTPEQKTSFLAFAEDMHDQQMTDAGSLSRDGDYGPNETMTDILDYITTPTKGQDDAGSPYEGLWVPVLQHSPPNGESFLHRLRNLHVHPGVMRIIDAVLECTVLNATSAKKDCSGTGLLYPPPLRKGEEHLFDRNQDPLLNQESAGEGFDPSVAVLAPVFPSDDPSSLVGFTAGMISWREILEVMFPYLLDDVTVDLLWDVDHEWVEVLTARVTASEDRIEFVNPDMDNRARYMYSITSVYDLRMANAGSALAYITISPGQNWIESRRTMQPLLSGLLAAGIVVLGSLLFFAGTDGWCCCYPFRSSARGN